ncbi:hypothetical protein GJA_4761 [Janthinobacterium agaricidamnosum NBRC 102515 = DSM 9628]|uniref:Uncharacterized protein n=1 Tax=Janthinobacterium agaricidamnosum NBRC 102515 = DSM 9628 TaxID=1349767 RepID=W0VCH0_9BURK|nr:hypothetical protein GJA_4761 [Janthinobacterium agaricidamnosum NBRC 102515 = DSM 9628]
MTIVPFPAAGSENNILLLLLAMMHYHDNLNIKVAILLKIKYCL